jgi:hypothetical protein
MAIHGGTQGRDQEAQILGWVSADVSAHGRRLHNTSTADSYRLSRQPLQRNLIRHIAKHYASPEVDQSVSTTAQICRSVQSRSNPKHSVLGLAWLSPRPHPTRKHLGRNLERSHTSKAWSLGPWYKHGLMDPMQQS